MVYLYLSLWLIGAAVPGGAARAPGDLPPVTRAAGQAPVAPDSLPPLQPGRLAAEYAGGLLMGALGAGASGVVAAAVLDGCSELGCIVWPAAGILVGYMGGASFGVYAAGSRQDQTASVLATFVGSAAGMAVGLFLLGNTTADHAAPVLVALSMPVWGAMVGFNRTRRYREAPPWQGAALLDVRQGRLQAAAPGLGLRPDPLTYGTTPAWHVPLLRVQW